MSLLPLLGPYRDVKPRRPKGGPDQARDIEAVMEDSTVVWCAAGFRNQVSDSPDDKKWVKKKFKDDLASARKENPTLTAFLFFTNIDLRPGEIRQLKASAVKSGITHCEVFYRERLRQVLDSVQGMAYRLQYLGIEMSREEQSAFFNAFGDDIKSLLAKQHGAVDERLNAIDFWLASVRPLRQFWIIVRLDRFYSYEELGHFRFTLGMGGFPTQHDIFISGQDAVMRARQPDGTITSPFGTTTIIQARGAAPVTYRPTTLMGKCNRLIFRADLFGLRVLNHLDDMNHLSFTFEATASMTDHATSILVIGNRFVLADLCRYKAPDIILRADSVLPWPGTLSDEQKQIQMPLYAMGVFNFDRHTPKKYQLTIEDHQFLLY